MFLYAFCLKALDKDLGDLPMVIEPCRTISVQVKQQQYKALAEKIHQHYQVVTRQILFHQLSLWKETLFRSPSKAVPPSMTGTGRRGSLLLSLWFKIRAWKCFLRLQLQELLKRMPAKWFCEFQSRLFELCLRHQSQCWG